MIDFSRKLSILGPGLITACCAIGTSHFIQATRAGAYFGFDLIWVILFVHLVKYPFIEAGFRYTILKKENILFGYNRLNKYFIYLFLFITVISAIGGISALCYICSGIIKMLFKLHLDIEIISILLLFLCIYIVTINKYNLLNNIVKILLTLLVITTITVVIIAFVKIEPSGNLFYQDSPWNYQYIPFIIALMGWMPGPLEMSVWHSLWTEERDKTLQKITFNEAKFDFNFGYFITIFTAILFLSMGALTLNTSNQELSSNSTQFTSQLINSYISNIGNWSQIFVSIAILSAIFSTTLAFTDIYPKMIDQCLMIIDKGNIRLLQFIFKLIIFSMVIIVIFCFVNNFKALIDTVTIIAFSFSPFIAYFNYKLIFSDLIDDKYKHGNFIKLVCYIGFALFFISFVYIVNIIF